MRRQEQGIELITMNTKGKGAGTPILALKAMTGVFLSMPEDWLS